MDGARSRSLRSSPATRLLSPVAATRRAIAPRCRRTGRGTCAISISISRATAGACLAARAPASAKEAASVTSTARASGAACFPRRRMAERIGDDGGGDADGDAGDGAPHCPVCQGSTPVCVGVTCVECAASADCKSDPTKPICDTTAHTCGPARATISAPRSSARRRASVWPTRMGAARRMRRQSMWTRRTRRAARASCSRGQTALRPPVLHARSRAVDCSMATGRFRPRRARSDRARCTMDAAAGPFRRTPGAGGLDHRSEQRAHRAEREAAVSTCRAVRSTFVT